MRIPKTINICGKTYKIVRNPKSCDSCGNTIAQKMGIGTEGNNSERILENILHETMELVACERGYRYGKGISEDSVIVMTHKQFDNFSIDIAAAIRPMLKE